MASCELSYSVSISGDCNNSSSGGFTINIFGQAPDFIIQWLSPYTTTIPLGAGVTEYTQNSLSAGTYTFNIIDSCSPNNTRLVNFNISNGTCVSITNTQNTLCGLSNGSLTATTSNLYNVANFSLYDNVTGFLSSGDTNDNYYVFSNLSASTYYVIANDGGGCTGKTESTIIKSSTTIDYSFYTVEDAGCTTQSGKIYITGLTGNPPYTYLWSNGHSESFITGLTAGSYSVAVTDSTGCEISKSVDISTITPVSIGSLLVTPPSCFTSDGDVTALVVNGTPPYYYSGSNGNVHISFSTSYTFTGVGPGLFSVQVTDAGLCTSVSSVSVATPGGFSLVNVTVVNSNCSDIGGKIKPISIFGGSGNYIYTLTYPSGGVVTQPTTSTSWGFENLSGGTYTLNIDDGVCSYTNQYTIVNTILYNLNVSTIDTTNNLSNGSVTLSITSGGTPPYNYLITGGSTNLSISTPLTSYTFNNLIYGNYTAKVTDSTFCSQSKPFIIHSSVGLDFVLIGQDANNGNDGSLSVFITDGNPPFTIQWQGVLSAQTGSVVSNLSPGTYCVKITDFTGGVKELCKTIYGYKSMSSTQYYNICDTTLVNTGELIQKGIKQMFFEGYYDLTLRDVNCVLNSATFTMNVTVGSYQTSALFYVSDSINSYPSTDDVLNQLDYLITYSPHIGNVVIQDNTITITTDCEEDSLVTTNVVASVDIFYDVSCVSCDISVTPTPTPTITQTPTMTPTPTHTPTPTPTSPLVYYVITECPEKSYIIQHILPLPGLVVGNSFAGVLTGHDPINQCYQIINSSTSLTQLLAQYPGALYPPPSNYFDSVVNTIYNNCDNCNKENVIKAPLPIIQQCTIKYQINKDCNSNCDVGYGNIKSSGVTVLNINQQLPIGIINNSFNADIDSLIEISFNLIPSTCNFVNSVTIGVYDEFNVLVLPEINVLETDANPTAYLSFILNNDRCGRNLIIKITENCQNKTEVPNCTFIKTNLISEYGFYMKKDIGVVSGYRVWAWYKETSQPNSCYTLMEGIGDNVGGSIPTYPNYTAPGYLGGGGFDYDLFSNGVQYSLFFTTKDLNSPHSPWLPGAVVSPVVFGVGQNSGDFTSYCGPNNPFIFTPTSGPPTIYINVKVLNSTNWVTCSPNINV